MSRVLPFLATLLLAAACSSPKLYRANHDRLAAAAAELEAGELEAATDRLEALIASTEGDAEGYPVQRLYAAVLLVQAHELASLGAAFLPGGGPRGARFESVSEGRLAEVAHLVAATWWVSFGQAWSAAADDAPTQAEGQPLVPESLAQLDAGAARDHLDLALVYVYSRLDFPARVEGLLAAHPELATQESTEEALARAHMPAGTHAWIHWALFQSLAAREPREAYRFGIRAREAAEEAAGTFGPERSTAIVDWILNHPDYVWRSSADRTFDPTRDRCPDTGEANVEFLGYPKRAGS